MRTSGDERLDELFYKILDQMVRGEEYRFSSAAYSVAFERFLMGEGIRFRSKPEGRGRIYWIE